jgi:hypothetical protein
VPYRLDPGNSPDYVWNNLTRQHGDFMGPARKSYCTELTANVAALTGGAVLRFQPEGELTITPIEQREGSEDSGS